MRHPCFPVRPSCQQRPTSARSCTAFSRRAPSIALFARMTTSGRLATRIYAPRQSAAEELPGLVYFHGGAGVMGSLDTHDGICRLLANTSGCRVVSVAYRLAPEHRFPAAVEDAFAAVAWVAQRA